MTLRLNGSTSGYVEIDAPATAGSNTLVLPTGNGSNGQVLSTNGSGALSWVQGGRILQVVNSVKTDTFSTASTTFVDVSGVSASITPASTSNKILVTVSFAADHDSSSYPMFRILRDSTSVLLGDSAGTRIQVTFGTSAASGNRPQTASYTLLDSPNATSATTYKVQMRVASGTGYVNRSALDTDTTGYFRSAAAITLMEVAA